MSDAGARLSQRVYTVLGTEGLSSKSRTEQDKEEACPGPWWESRPVLGHGSKPLLKFCPAGLPVLEGAGRSQRGGGCWEFWVHGG